MAAGEFRWTSLRAGLLREIRDELKLGKRKPEIALADVVVVPDDEFVRTTWPLLRDRWLATESSVRSSVVGELRAKHLGDSSLKTGTAAADLEYLRSCNNSKVLRGIVLAHLLAVGSATEQPQKHTATNPKPTGKVALARVAEEDWQRFTNALALTLAQLEVDQFLIVAARRHRAYYVQFAQDGPAGLAAEAISNQYLADFEKLDDEAVSKMRELGWKPPEVEPGNAANGSPNWRIGWTLPVPYPEAAHLGAETLRSVYEVRAPAYLTYRAFAHGGAEIILPNLGIVREAPTNAPQPSKKPSASEAVPLTRDVVIERVRGILAERIGVPEVAVDADGDIPLSNGVAQVFVRVQPDAPVISVFGSVIWDIGTPLDIAETVNQINGQMRFGRAWWNGKGVFLSSDVIADPLDGANTWNAVMAVMSLIAEHAPKLQERYGGSIQFGFSSPFCGRTNVRL